MVYRYQIFFQVHGEKRWTIKQMKLEKLNNHLTSPPTMIRLLSKDINIKTKVSESGHKIRNRTLNISQKVKCESITLSHVQLFVTPWTGAQQLLSPWNSPGQNTGVSCHFLLQGIFPTQRLNLGFLHCKQILYCLNHQGVAGMIAFLSSQTYRLSCYYLPS